MITYISLTHTSICINTHTCNTYNAQLEESPCIDPCYTYTTCIMYMQTVTHKLTAMALVLDVTISLYVEHSADNCFRFWRIFDNCDLVVPSWTLAAS